MTKVYSLQEARDWFIENHSGSVICVSVIDRDEITITASFYPMAAKFYKQNALLSKYRSVTSLSTKELAEIKEKCDELGISVHEALPNIWNETGKGPIDEKNDLKG